MGIALPGAALARAAGLAAVVALAATANAWGAAKKKPSAPPANDGRRVVLVEPVEGVSIELPDSQVRNFGDDFKQRIWKKLEDSGRYIVAINEPHLNPIEDVVTRLAAAPPPDYTWHGTYVPSAKVRIIADGMTFVTGSRGQRMFYGFDSRMRNEFNDGIGGVKNEFPLKTLSFDPNWFDQTFEEKGSGLSNSHTGLEIGEGMSINALFAWLAIKYETYQATLDLRIIVDAPLASRHEYRVVQVKGSGFFFDISGAYQGYSAGIRVARRDAMLQSFIRAIDGAYAAVERAVEGLPLAGRIDVVLADGTILVGTGFDSQIRSGVFFQVVDDPSVIIEVTGQSTQGSVGRIVRGNPELAKPGKIVRQIYRLPREGGPASFASALVNEAEGGEPVLAAVEKIELPAKNLHKSDFKDGEAPDVSWVQAFFKNIIESVTLPYRIWRYFRYDVAYQRTADSSGGYGPGEEGPPSETPVDWSVRSRDEWWAVKTGLWLLEVEPPLGVKGAPVVAVIDTGVDYNHPAVHDALWLNPFPLLDTRGYQDRYGWDFISGDGRPFDDAYHGTWMASAVTAVIPSAKIMPLKVFNPWGITNSGALYGAFVYAVDHGAQIILCGWATRHQSAAIDKGVAYASTHGVVVVAAAGDRGDELANNPAYPASLSGRYDNVVTVTGVDEYDTLVKEYGRYANHGSKAVTLAAPGKSVLVAAPRQREMRETSTAIASALVAGALARIWVAHPGCGGHVCLLDALKASADPVPALQGSVSGGLRLRFRD